jgi:hypothetical protein
MPFSRMCLGVSLGKFQKFALETFAKRYGMAIALSNPSGVGYIILAHGDYYLPRRWLLLEGQGEIAPCG